jgi:hypothetical protein
MGGFRMGLRAPRVWREREMCRSVVFRAAQLTLGD